MNESLNELYGFLLSTGNSVAESTVTVSGALPWLLEGAGITVATVLCAMFGGLIFGVIFAVGQVYGPAWVKRLIGLYVWFFRGVPILVLLYLFYFGLANQLGLDISAFTASCIVLGLTSTAYQSQIFRGSMLSISQGQLKAGLALGMSMPVGIINIVLPQALRLAIPGWTNEYSILLKDSALVSVLGTMELMARTKAIATSTADYGAFYISAALLYFIITFIGVRTLRFFERKVQVPGYAAT